MRGRCFGLRQLIVSSLYTVLVFGCAESGLSDADLAAAEGKAGDEDDDSSDATGRKDAGKDARAAADDEEVDSGSKKDAGSASGSDASRAAASRTDAGGGSTLPTIKCPSNLICTTDISAILSVLDPSVKADTPVCAQSGVLPMAVSCKSDSECKSARLTSAKCTGNYCIQACIK